MAYAGDPRRDTHAGNTPPLFLWRADTSETGVAWREGITTLRRVQAATGAMEGFELLPDDASVSSVQYDGPHAKAVYLVNRGQQSVPADRLELKVPIGAQSVEVYADTARGTRLSDRTVALPRSHGPIVKLMFV
jgi:hypothetical protein